MSEEGKKSVWAQLARGGLYGVLLLLGAFLVLVILSAAPYLLQMGYHLLCGWLIHASNALPPFIAKWQAAMLPLGCLLMAAVIGHRFVCRYVDEKFPERKWRIRHTAGALSLLLLGSAAAIALSGVVHQFFWLGRGEIIESRGASERAIITLHTRNLAQAVLSFHNMNGRYPDSDAEFYREYFGDDFAYPHWIGEGGVAEPILFLHPGRKEVLSSDEVLVVSPAFNNGRQVVVVMGDGEIQTINFEDLSKLLSEIRTKESEEVR